MKFYTLTIVFKPSHSVRAFIPSPLDIAAEDDNEAERQGDAIASLLMSGFATEVTVRIANKDGGPPIATINRP